MNLDGDFAITEATHIHTAETEVKLICYAFSERLV
jgi:hypothetical protein